MSHGMHFIVDAANRVMVASGILFSYDFLRSLQITHLYHLSPIHYILFLLSPVSDFEQTLLIIYFL